MIAHELGHNLGSYHDQDSSVEPLAANCLASDNYIMTPSIGLYQTNLLNLFKFSSCSIAQFKKTLLSSDKRYLKSLMACLYSVNK